MMSSPVVMVTGVTHQYIHGLSATTTEVCTNWWTHNMTIDCRNGARLDL